MVKGFEDFTAELDGYDKVKLLPPVIAGLKTKIGKQSAITNKKMVEAMTARGYNINEAKMRKIINYIRNNALVPCLLATSNGYYIGESLEEMEDYCRSLEQREAAIKQVRIAMRAQIAEKYQLQNQKTLFDGDTDA